jgi:succinyl-diaminopimelate desuccinylase
MLDAKRRSWLAEAWARVSEPALIKALRLLVNIPSPTGQERPLAEAIASRLNAGGLTATVQRVDTEQANALGLLAGSGDGKSLLLYAPIDTVTSNNEAEDVPWVGPKLRPDMRAQAYVEGDNILGLGAHNPKGHAACIILAAEALAATGVRFLGDLRLGFGAGGMPTNARAGMRPNSGHGAGCAFMLDHGPLPDFAVIAKSGWTISWEEVGFCWFEVRVRGTHNYVGSRHLLPYRSAIHDAMKLIDALENWFPTWTSQHRSGLVAPQGVVSFIEAGWRRMPAFTPAICRFRVDLRIAPDTTPAAAKQAFGDMIESTARDLGIDVEWETIVEIPGSRTPMDNWIIRSAISGWETIEGRPHEVISGLSGATDANILRAAGVPTARVGLPKARLSNMDFALGMNAANVADMMRLTRHLIYVAIDTCTRPRAQIDA